MCWPGRLSSLIVCFKRKVSFCPCPFSQSLHYLADLSETTEFVLAALALIPLAWLIGEATGWGLFESSWLGSPKLAMYAILVVNLWQGCATPIVLLIAGLQSVPQDLYEAASIDGANAWQRFKSITIPYLIPVLNIVIVTSVKGGLTTFDYIKAMTDGGPMQSTESVGILIYNHAMQEGRFGYSVAESMILFVIIALVSVATMRMTENKKVGD